MDGETFITAPSSAPQLKRFFQTYPVENFQAITFFKFHEIRHRERQAAARLYRNIVYTHALSLCNPKVVSAVALDWSSGKKTREDYWRQKEKEEEEDSRMRLMKMIARYAAISFPETSSSVSTIVLTPEAIEESLEASASHPTATTPFSISSATTEQSEHGAQIWYQAFNVI
ncbi:hypothetical protein BGZ51_005896 [Haplosporangium sp. Z 767]|nr:hypothetical protein BGZ51_005896 [Haplosporangium sp. Z 767]